MNQFHKLTEKHWLIIIVCVAFGLRSLGVLNIELAGDFAYHWQVAGNIVRGIEFPLVGPSASIQDSFHLGPFYFYFLAVVYFLSMGSFQLGIIWLALINSVGILFLYKAARLWFSKKDSAVIIALVATSYYLITVGNFPWNPYLLPPFLFGLIWLLERARRGESQLWPAIAVVAAIAVQLHGAAFFLLPVVFTIALLARIPLKKALIALSVFFLLFSSWLLVEVRCNFCQLSALSTALFNVPTESCSLGEWLVNHGHGERCFGFIRNSLFVLRMVAMSLIGSSQLIVLPAVLGLLLAWLKYAYSKKTILWLLWLIIPWSLFLFYNGNVYVHYFLIFLPLPYFFLVTTLRQLQTHFSLKENVVNGLWLGIMTANVLLYLFSLQHIRG